MYGHDGYGIVQNVLLLTWRRNFFFFLFFQYILTQTHCYEESSYSL
jgi:hypothetical protein